MAVDSDLSSLLLKTHDGSLKAFGQGGGGPPAQAAKLSGVQRSAADIAFDVSGGSGFGIEPGGQGPFGEQANQQPRQVADADFTTFVAHVVGLPALAFQQNSKERQHGVGQITKCPARRAVALQYDVFAPLEVGY